MNEQQEAYARGFMQKCAARGFDPEALLKVALSPLEGILSGNLAGVVNQPPPTNRPMGEGNALVNPMVPAKAKAPVAGSGNPTAAHPATGVGKLPEAPAAYLPQR